MYAEAEVLSHGAFQQAGKKAAFRDIVCRLDQFVGDQASHGLLYLVLFLQLKVRCRAMGNTTQVVQVFRAVDIVVVLANEVYAVAGMLEAERHFLVHIIQHAHHTYGRCRVYRPIFTLVVEAYVTTGYRGVELETGFTHAFYSMYELVVNFRIVWVTKVQAVGNSYRQAAAAYYVARCFAHRYHSALVRVCKYITAVTVGSYRKTFLCTMHAYHCCITGFVSMRIARTYHAVVLLIYPALGGDVGELYQLVCHLFQIGRLRNGIRVKFLYFCKVFRFAVFALVYRCTAAQYQAFGRHISYQLAVHIILQVGIFCYLSYLHAVYIPLVEYRLYLMLAAFYHHDEHTLLAFAQQHFPWLHIGLAGWYLVQVYDHAMLALGAHFAGAAGNTRGTHILHAYQRAGRYHLQAGLQQFLFFKWVTHLYRWQLLCTVGSNIGRCKRRTANTIFTGRSTYYKYWVARTMRGSGNRLSYFHHTYAHSVYQRIGLVAAFVVYLSGYSRYAKAVAVMAYAFHHALYQPARFRVIYLAEAQ